MRALERSISSWAVAALLVTAGACSTGPKPTTVDPGATTEPEGGGAELSVEAGADDPRSWIAAAEEALRADRPARAAALFARYLGQDPTGEGARRAYPGLARAHEALGDFEAAIRAYNSYLAHFGDDPEAPAMIARRGACEAEIGQWERSAASYAEVLERGGDDLLPSQRVEALTREGYALYELGRHDDADARFAEADAIYEAASEGGEERFSDTYFVAMARFYRAAIIHLRFREVPVRLPEAQMEKDFERKLELLEQAQEAYNEVIRARHVYWVSAAGFQLGALFEEFYDAIMHAPVPDWLDEAQRRVYYEELEEQLRPVIDKAVWVFEKNLETARKLGYENQFVELTQERLAQLQAVMLGRDASGAPIPRLAPSPEDGRDTAAVREDELPAVERKLFVPLPTTL